MATCSTVYQVPGQKGSQGAAGTNGTDGINAFTTLAAQFTVPSGENLSPTVSHESDGTTATVIMGAAHNLATGMIVDISGFTDANFDATDVTVTVVDGTTFSYPTGAPAAGVVADVTGVVSNIRVPVTLTDGSWVSIGQFLHVESIGTFEVVDVSGNVSTLKNPYDGAAGSYPNNVAAGTIAAIASVVSPAGMQGVGGQGFQGVQGPQGTQGNQGFQGVSGGGGAQGFQGFQGFQGSSGAGADNGKYSFRARVSTTIANPGVPATVIFDTEEFDPDAAYDNGTGVYTAAATGVYQFNVKINSTTNSGTFWLQVNTVSIYQIGTLLYDFTGAVLLSLTATDTVRIWFSGSNVLGTNLGVSRSEFSGFLVR